MEGIDYTPGYTRTQLALMLAAAGLGYHLYYRTSKKVFKKSFLSKYTEKDSMISEYHSRVLAMTCAVIVTTLAAIYSAPPIVRNFFTMENLFNMKLEYFDTMVLVLLFGYLIHDIFWCMMHGWHDALNYVHHAVSIWFCITMLLVNNTAFEATIGITLAESSNIFLHLRWFVKFFKGKNSLICDAIFAFVFFVMRIVGGTWITYHLLKNSGPYPVRVMCYTLDILNVGFSIQILGMMKRNIKKMSAQRRERKAKEAAEKEAIKSQ